MRVHSYITDTKRAVWFRHDYEYGCIWRERGV